MVVFTGPHCGCNQRAGSFNVTESASQLKVVGEAGNVQFFQHLPASSRSTQCSDDSDVCQDGIGWHRMIRMA